MNRYRTKLSSAAFFKHTLISSILRVNVFNFKVAFQKVQKKYIKSEKKIHNKKNIEMQFP